MSTAPFNPEALPAPESGVNLLPHEINQLSDNLWLPMHRGYNSPEGRKLQELRIDSLADSMREMGINLSQEDVDNTKGNMDRAYNQYANPVGLFENGHAFTAPTRISASDFTSIQESFKPFPILSALDKTNISKEELSQKIGLKVSRMLELCPPMVMENYIDTPGAIIFCPITSQIGVDYDRREALTIARSIASDTALFAQRGKAKVLGLGATLPSLTGYGKYIDAGNELAITTGHAGTAVLVGKLIRKKVEESPELSSNPIAVIGAGAMGSVLAEYVISTGRDVVAYDENQKNLTQLVKNLGSEKVASAINLDSALASANIIISAVTKSISLENSEVDMSGKLIIDDSQPGAFLREEVEQLNGELTWVVGRAEFLKNTDGWSYADTIHSGDQSNKDAVFGCEAESAVIARAAREHGINPNVLSVRGRPVTLNDIFKMSRLFNEYGIDIAPSQSYGIINN